MELERTVAALRQKGAVWKTVRLTRSRFQDTVECTTIIRDGIDIIRGVMEFYDNTDVKKTKMEVTCYFQDPQKPFDGELGGFKPGKHPKDKQGKSFEYKKEVPYKFSKIWGWRPAERIPAEHRFIEEMCLMLAAKTKAEAEVTKAEAEAKKEEDKAQKEARANRALFG